MDYSVLQEVRLLETEIAKYPKGYISEKTINGKKRYYLQWRENGKTKSRYIKEIELEVVRFGVVKRKELQARLDAIKNRYGELYLGADTQNHFATNVLLGEALSNGCGKAAMLESRDCFSRLEAYLNADTLGKVCLIYGLRRTGKTTMLFQAMAKLPRDRVAYIKATPSDTMASLNVDMRQLATLGYRYIFLDEITLLEDFIDSAALFSDIYAMQGIKVVLSGTDSLGFWFAEHEELYDRAYMIHTTFIPFREHSRLLQVQSIDEYIRYGGTLRAGVTGHGLDVAELERASFADDESTRVYIDAAICKNIQHSLEFCEAGGHFRHLLDLYEAGELTGAIQRIIEDMNHRFVLSVLTRAFRSGDLRMAQKNLRKEVNPEFQTDILDRIDEKEVVERLKELLEIKNKSEQTVTLTEAHVVEIKQYLKALDLIVECPLKVAGVEDAAERYLIAQPGMRFCQAQALVEALFEDKSFLAYSEREKALATERILNEVRGRMLEDIVLLECSKVAKKHQKVFKLQFDAGELDMVVYNAKEDCCSIYEIKHSDKVAEEQYRHLIDAEKCEQVQKKYGCIMKKIVLYRGESMVLSNGVQYRNAEEFLKQLPASLE